MFDVSINQNQIGNRVSVENTIIGKPILISFSFSIPSPPVTQDNLITENSVDFVTENDVLIDLE